MAEYQAEISAEDERWLVARLEGDGYYVEADPVILAASISAQLSWLRPFAIGNNRTALLTAATVLDLGKIAPPRDWAGFSSLLLELKESSASAQTRSQRLAEWLNVNLPGRASTDDGRSDP